MIKAEFKLDKRFKQRLVGRYERYTVEAGVLEDKPHRDPRPAKQGLGSLQGGPVRKMKQTSRGKISDVSENIRKVHGIDYLRIPVERRNSKDMKNFRKLLIELLQGKIRGYSKVEAALRAVIRNPILNKQYGANSRLTRAIKTFNRKLIDTGQFFKAIKAKVRSGRVQK